MDASGDAEVLRVAADLRVAKAIISSTALALAIPTLIVLAWAAFLRPTGSGAAHFAARGLLTPGAAP
jgi:hypothetical protein